MSYFPLIERHDVVSCQERLGAALLPARPWLTSSCRFWPVQLTPSQDGILNRINIGLEKHWGDVPKSARQRACIASVVNVE